MQGNESRVSHASLWTSLYPLNHHFIAEKAKLDPKFVTLPEAVKPTGRTTVGLMGNGFIDAFWGFGEGWDVLKNHIHEGGGLKAEDFVVEAKQMLGKLGAKPYFMYLGTIDAHVSWRAHMPWIAKYDPEPYNGPFVKACLDPQLDKIVAGKMAITDRDKTRIIALYDSDVSYNDQQFGKLLELLNADDTMVIFTADHGEELWDHGTHRPRRSLREELVHVPLLISYPPLFPAGQDGERGRRDHRPVCRRSSTRSAARCRPTRRASRSWRWRRAKAPAIRGRRSRRSTSWRTRCASARWKLSVCGSGDVRLFDAATDAAEAKELQTERPLETRFVDRRHGRVDGVPGAVEEVALGRGVEPEGGAGARSRRRGGYFVGGDDGGSRFQQMISSVSARTNAGSRPTSP